MHMFKKFADALLYILMVTALLIAISIGICVMYILLQMIQQGVPL